MNNVPMTDWDPHDVVELGLSMVPEGRELFGELTVTENRARRTSEAGP